ncbi:hypothetical protein [Pseudarthrobacter sp. NIBRBAC000502772]|uniref:hypothetical protein n=1 Tax=Pseudarthrobacter sp. NIBRBAC000502772 TaxID=2590775 RepID=UPI00143CC0F6|nr:hypothetical protein [Pseudarthrobacter sp. NIBRBAC000502772]
MNAPAGVGVVSSLSGLPAVGLDELNAEAALQTRVDPPSPAARPPPKTIAP